MIHVDYQQCEKMIDILKKLNLPEDTEEPLIIDLPDSIIIDSYFILVAICHQTSPINGPIFQGKINGVQYKGWDYLRQKWFTYISLNKNTVNPSFLASMNYKEFIDIFQDDSGTLHLSDINKRIQLLNNLGQIMLANNYTSVNDIYEKSSRYLVNFKYGLLELLSEFEAYSDPIQKKSLYLLSLMKNHGFWIFNDDNNLAPPVDYHEVRGHLRFGNVLINNKHLRSKLITCQIIDHETDNIIRAAVRDSILYISKHTNLSPSKLHYFFWNFFRNCCSKNSPHCIACSSNCCLPERYASILHTSNTCCIFYSSCKSRSSSSMYNEPLVDTFYY